MEPNHPLCVALREILPPVVHQALQRPSTFEQTGLDLELVHSAGFRPWDRGGERRSGGGGEGGGGRFPKEIFLALRASVWSKNEGGGGAPWPFRWIRHWFVFTLRHTLHVWQFFSSQINSTFFSCWFISLKKKKYSHPFLTISKEVTFKSRTKNQRNNHTRNACLPRDSEWTALPTLSRPDGKVWDHRMGDNPPGISCLETNYLFLGKIQQISWLPDKTDYLMRHLKYLLWNICALPS